MENTRVDEFRHGLPGSSGYCTEWWAAVYGELAARQKFDRKQQTVMPALRDALWYGDGTKLNLYYKGRDKSGRLVKKTAMVYEVIDAYSEMLLGYCIGEVENARCSAERSVWQSRRPDINRSRLLRTIREGRKRTNRRNSCPESVESAAIRHHIRRRPRRSNRFRPIPARSAACRLAIHRTKYHGYESRFAP